MNENMKVWNAVSKTDPKHTKDFTRSGGFKGTAIKPMYAIQKMTETFGACGEGWGYTKPEYQIVDGTEGQKLVYCTVGLWYGEHSKENPPLLVWGVGGDFIIVKQSGGLRSDDEAFKKAFTDALMNAMKHIGMSADVHMGQFDASKYVQPEPKKSEAIKNYPGVQDDMKDLGYDYKKVYDTVIEELGTVTDSETLTLWVKRNKDTRRMQGLPDDLKTDVKNRHDSLKTMFTDKGI